MAKRKVRRQPRLRGDEVRVIGASSFHPVVRENLEEIAHVEGKSFSWVVHEVVASFFGLDIMGAKIRFRR